MNPDDIEKAIKDAKLVLRHQRGWPEKELASAVLALSDQLTRERENAAALLHRPEPVSRDELGALVIRWWKSEHPVHVLTAELLSRYTITRKDDA